MTLHLPTGFASLDILLGGGFRREELIVLGGESGVGCSALGLGLAVRAAERGASVAMISTEMSPTRLAERALAQAASATLAELGAVELDDRRRAEIARVALHLRGLSLAFLAPPLPGSDRDALTIGEEHDLLVVDALEGLSWEPYSRADAAAAWVLAWKRLAIRRAQAIVLIRHANPGDSPSTGGRPTIATLGDAGVREQADLILALHRDDLHRPDPTIAGAAELLLLKDRCGTTGSVDLWFEPRWSRFEDLAEA